MRKKIYDLLNALYPSYFLGQKDGMCEDTYLVIKFNEQQQSLVNTKGAFQYLEVMVYVSQNSIAPIDGAIKGVIEAIREVAEPTGYITPDFLDTDVQAYTKSIQFKMKKESF
jgi:hypothetical protein